MKTHLARIAAISVALFAVSTSAGTWMDQYWPLNDGDQKVLRYGNAKELHVDTIDDQDGTFQLSEEENSESLVVSEDSTGCYLTEVKAGWLRAYFDPPVLLFDDNTLQNGGKEVTATMVSQTGLSAYPATFTVKIGKAGTIKVPAGTFTDCRSISTTERARIPGHGTVTASALTAYMAPGVGIVKMLVAPGKWGVLTSGTIAGVPVGGGAGTSPMAVVVYYGGSVSPDYNGQWLQVGKSYTVTAKPEPGYLFVNWTDAIGNVLGTASKLTFNMQSNLVLYASFAVNPFASVAGTYSGLLARTDTATPDGSGFFTLAITKKGTYSGKVLMGGKSYPLSGRFDPYGWYATTFGNATLTLQVDVYYGSGTVSGSWADQAWTASLSGQRAGFDGKGAIAPQRGKYTWVAPGAFDPALPAGDSYGTLIVDRAGRLHASGVLADGTKFTQAASLFGDGTWPLYSPLYGRKGAVMGWLYVADTSMYPLSGQLNWMKPPGAPGLYSQGFTLPSSLMGSHYQTPAGGQGVLSAGTATLMLAGGDLEQSLASGMTLSATGGSGDNKASLSFARSTGLFSGKVSNPSNSKPIRFQGVALQDQNVARGFFLGTTGSGSVLLSP